MIEISHRTYLMLRKTVSDAFAVPAQDISRVFFHGLLLASVISGFWLLDSLKDPILSSTIGIEYVPIAKLFTVLTTLIVVCLYDYLTKLFTKPYLFHITSWSYGFLFMIISAILSDPIRNVAESQQSYRAMGWVAFFAIESYGSLMVALFWSFTNSVIDLEEAKGAYGLMIALGQLGALFGSTLATSADLFGVPQLFIMAAMNIFTVSLLMKAYCIIYKNVPSVIKVSTAVDKLSSYSDNADSSGPTIMSRIYEFFGGFSEGLLLILKYPYTMKILAVSCLYEIVLTVLDYEFKILGAVKSTHMSSAFTSSLDENEFANLLGHFGQLTNFLSFLISIFGFSNIVKAFGVKHSLLMFPVTLFIVLILNNLYLTLPVILVSVSIVKAMIFALHDPVHELLYNPTSDSIKFKAKVWIDVFGSRSAKAIGSIMTNASGSDVNKLRSISELPCLILSLVIILVAYSVGDEFQNLLKTGHIIDGVNKIPNNQKYALLPIKNGLKPGDVGYDGYDEELFEGVFEDPAEVNASPHHEKSSV